MSSVYDTLRLKRAHLALLSALSIVLVFVLLILPLVDTAKTSYYTSLSPITPRSHGTPNSVPAYSRIFAPSSSHIPCGSSQMTNNIAPLRNFQKILTSSSSKWSTAVPAASSLPSMDDKTSPILEKLSGISLPSVSDNEAREITSILSLTGEDGDNGASTTGKRKRRVLIAFFTQWGDFDSFEMAQRLVPYIPKLEEEGVKLVAIGIGEMEGAKTFARLTGFPESKLYVDSEAKTHSALGFEAGFGRRSTSDATAGKTWWTSDSALKVTEGWSPYAKLLAMCAGLGSPGTLQEVFRGYLGDKNSPEIKDRFPGVLPDQMSGLFGVLGDGYQRPFELATVRLLNMGNILTRWEDLTPKDKNLILQRGGAIILDADGEVLYRHDDKGILGYADVDEIVEVATASSS